MPLNFGTRGPLPSGLSKVQDGGTTSSKPLMEGYERKGGLNGQSQIQTRPAAPPPFKPANSQSGGGGQAPPPAKKD
jgi:hypothetical protein